MRRQAVKNRHQNGGALTETKIREMSGRKSPQKRTISRRAGNARFARTGWWCAQSDTNRSRFPNCLIKGFLQGIFANCCLLSENAPGLAALIQWLTSEFPKGRNRPLLVFIRGRFSKNRTDQLRTGG